MRRLLLLLALLSPLVAVIGRGLTAEADRKPPFYADKANLLVYLDGAGRPVPVKSAEDWPKRRDHILANMQLVMGPLPPAERRVPLDLKVEAEETLARVVRKKVTFAVEKGDRVTAYLLMPRGLKGKAPALLCLHQTTAIGKGEPAGVGGRDNLHYALELAERGYVTLAPDYPNFGDYKLDAYARGYASATMKGVWNHMRAVDLLQALPEVDGSRIGVIGHSLGGHNSMFVAAFDPRVGVVVSSCGFNSFAKYRKGRLADWSHKGYMPRIASEFGNDATKVPFDFTEILGSLAPRAVFVNAPLRDNDFEVEGVRDCVAAARPVYGLFEAAENLEVVYPDAGHDFPPDVRLRAYAFIDRHLRPRVEFTRLIAHWAEYGDADYLKFVEEARPEVCQIGFYGGHFYSLAQTPQYSGYPAHFPVRGLAECGRWFQERNAELHKRGAKVVGHFNVSFLVGEPGGKEEPRGFFKFYRDLWDEKELGPRPVADPLDLLARNADGSPMASKTYSIGDMREFTACLNNPHWRAVLKAWAKRGIERGVDGYVMNYYYRHNCLCRHCQTGFRAYLGERFTPEQLRARFGIADLNSHKFTEIVGWHDPKESTPLRREMLRWSQISSKAAFDEVFVQYARSLRLGLILGQWNHLGDFNQINGDERCLLPGELWGRDEDYLWYSTGGTACFTDLAEGILGEATLQARYIRGAFDDRPFTLGKYESTRIRVAIAELAANGGAPMGFYTNFKNDEARREIVRYYHFLEKNDAVFRGNRSHAEVLLLYPRSKVHEGDVAAVEAFRKLGRQLLDQHVLFDVVPDDRLTAARRARYRAILDPTKPARLPAALSRFEAPATVRVAASRQATGQELTLHFVNYNRQEPAAKRSPGTGIQDEKPLAVEGVAVDLELPPGANVSRVLGSSPESPDAVEVKFTVRKGRVQFAMPKFLVYSLARVRLTSD
jgi:dienelactone hydrolase